MTRVKPSIAHSSLPSRLQEEPGVAFSPYQATDHGKKHAFGVVSDLLIPGRGEPVENGSIVVEGGKITAVGQHEDITRNEKYRDLKWHKVKVLMPGMWGAYDIS